VHADPITQTKATKRQKSIPIIRGFFSVKVEERVVLRYAHRVINCRSKKKKKMVLRHRRERIKQTNVLPRSLRDLYATDRLGISSDRTLEAPGLLDYTAHEFATPYICSICLGQVQMTTTDEFLGEREGAEEFGEHDRRGVLHIDSRPNISADAIIMSDGGP